MSTPAHDLQISVDEYLKLEETSTVRHEFLDGRVFAMVGSSEAHNAIVSNLNVLIANAIRGTGCRTFVADMKVRVEATNSFYYPDVMVTCEPFMATSLYKTAPRLIIEVLSPSTADIDRREKLLAYRLIESLQQYAIVYQDERTVEVYTRTSDRSWTLSVYHDRETLVLAPAPSTELSLSLDSIYEGVI
ncbi:MAG TPA: Uma2 family endonuclease [Candidatus Obscuribacterales bacterium]